MKKFLCLLLACCVLFSFSACRKKSQTPETQTNNAPHQNAQSSQVTTPQNTPPVVNKIDTDTSMVAVSVPADTIRTDHANGTCLFQYTSQHIVLTLSKPEIADKIIFDFMGRVDNTKEAADSIANKAKDAYQSGQNWMPYLYSILYSPTRIDHNVLSFSGVIEEYTGGPHPNRSGTYANYDLLTGDVLTLASIMHKDASVSTIRDMVLAKLEEISASTTLYESYSYTVKQRFETEATNDEGWYFTQSGLCFAFFPYEIAPYSSGIITVELPYEKLGTILHEDYLPLGRNVPEGNVHFTPIENVDMSNTAQFAELVTDHDAKKTIAQTNSHIQDIRIKVSDKSTTYTIFAAYGLYQGGGITIQADEAIRAKMAFSYKTGNQTVTTPIK